jgi:hypothetical protein
MANKLDEILNIEPQPVLEPEEVVVPPNTDTVEDIDFDNVRANYYELLDQGKAAMNTAMRIAAESENPRAIEVLSGLFKNVADVNKQLLSLSKDKADIKAVKRSGSNPQQSLSGQTIQNAVFVGNGADLNKLLADRLKG